MRAHERHIPLAPVADEAGQQPRAGSPRSAGPELPKRYKRLAGLGILALLAACSGPEGPNPDVERARSEVNRVAAMPVVTQHAPLELKQATDTVERADRNWREEGDGEEARHRAYLATQRAAIAENFARAREAGENIKLANATADKQRLDASTREAAAARQEAGQQAQRAAAAEARLRDIEAQQTERGLLVTLGDVLFETGKSDLLAPAFPKLDRLAQFLRQHPDRMLLVEGYTDSVGSESLNLGLSERRAESVRRALAQRGVDMSRISTRGYGESYPVADNGSAEGRALNRRVEVLITDERGTLRPRG